MQRLRDFVRREVVLVVAIVLAAASCIAVPPDAAYSAYIDWHTLALLFCLMAVVAGLRSLGVLDSMGKWLVSRAKSQRAIAFALVGIVFFASMAVTNDVALITFVPLALVTLRAAGMEGHALLVAALMTVAANLGSMLTPVGNPQNLYLFTASGMSVSRFLSLMAPYTGLSAALLGGCILVLFRSKPCCGEEAGKNKGCVRGAADGEEIVSRSCWSDGAAHEFANGVRKDAAPAPLWRCSCGRLAIYLVLFCICLLAVAGIVDVRIVLAVVIAAVALTDAEQLRRVDFALLLTFVALFVFVGNMVRIPLVHDAVAGLVTKCGHRSSRREPGGQQCPRGRAALRVHEPMGRPHRGHEPWRAWDTHRLDGEPYHLQGDLYRPRGGENTLSQSIYAGQRGVSGGFARACPAFWPIVAQQTKRLPSWDRACWRQPRYDLHFG